MALLLLGGQAVPFAGRRFAHRGTSSRIELGGINPALIGCRQGQLLPKDFIGRGRGPQSPPPVTSFNISNAYLKGIDLIGFFFQSSPPFLNHVTL